MFPTDLETAATTTTGDIHTASFLVNIVSVILSALLFAVSFWKKSDEWRSYRWTGLALAIALLAACIVQFVTLRPGAPYGLTNRLFVAADGLVLGDGPAAAPVGDFATRRRDAPGIAGRADRPT